MSDNYRHIVNGVNIVPKTPSTVSKQGDLDVDSGTAKLNYHNGTTSSPVVTEAQTATLTNKTIAAGSNTLSGITNTELSGSAGITNANLAAVSNNTVKGNKSGGSAVPSDLALSDVAESGSSILTVTNGAKSIVGASNLTIKANLTSANIYVGNVSNVPVGVAMSGDVAIDNTGATTIQASSVTNAKMANMAAHSYKGNNTASPAAPIDLTATQLTAELNAFVGDSGSGGTKGLVPAPASGDAAAGKFLKASGAWATVPAAGVSAVGTIDSQTASTDGLVISGSNIYAQSASATRPGLVNTTTQTMAGAKTFSTSLATPTLNDNGAGLAINTSAGQNLSLVTSSGGRLKLNANEGVDIAEVSTPSAPTVNYSSLYFKSDHLLYSLDTTGTERKIGSGSGLNYIGNPDASSTNGWVGYGNTAKNIPVTGTGGTPTGLTFASSLVSPLVGLASFTMTQTNSTNIQGKGVSYDFTIDSAYQASVLGVSFNYNASSTFVAADGITAPLNDGTTSTNAGNSDVEVFIYDVTNAVLIPVTPQVIVGKGSNNFIFSGSFQTSSNSTSYRLIYHVATANANATGWTFKFDNVFVGPQTISNAAMATDWKNDLTFTDAGYGTTGTKDYRYKRIGDTLYVKASFQVGTPSATAAGIIFPSGYTIDTSKLTTTANVQGVGLFSSQINGANASTFPSAGRAGMLFYDGSTNNQIFFGPNGASGIFVKQPGNTSASAGDFISVEFSVPITGWSSNTVMSNDTDTRVVTAKISGTPSSTTATNIIIYPTSDFDTHGSYSTGTGRYTVPVSGYYQVSGFFNLTNAITIYAYKNGSISNAMCVTAGGSGAGSTTVKASAGDLIDIRPDGTTGAFGGANNVTITRVSGPATIAASEFVGADYYLSASTAFSSAQINFDTKVFDTHGAVTTGAGWKFTAPVAGYYQVSASAGTSVGTDFRLNKNGASQRVLFYSNSSEDNATGTAVISLLAGDFIDLRTNANATLTGGTGNTQYTWISIAKVSR